MPATKEQMLAIAPKGGKAKAANRKARELAMANQNKAIYHALANPPTYVSPEAALERRIARLTEAGARPGIIDRAVDQLTKLRKSGGSRKREVQASPLYSHNINYTSIGYVAPQPLTQSQPVLPVDTTTSGSAGQPKESLCAGTPHTQAPLPPATVGPTAGISSLSTSTSFPVNGLEIPVNEAVMEDSGHAPWAPLAGAVPGPVGSEADVPKSERKEVACPGPGYVKVKVGSHWVWGKRNG